MDPGVGTSREIYLAQTAQHLFVGPDNGLFGELARQTRCSFRRIEQTTVERFSLRNRSSTFHGRDIFAPLVSNLASGRLSPAECGPVTNKYSPSLFLSATREEKVVVGDIITIDHFGNLISNVDEGLFSEMVSPRVLIADKDIPFRRNYSQVIRGELVSLINSFGVLEIARSNGDAARFLGVGRRTPVRVVES